MEFEFKGLATIKGKDFCCQPYHICASCDVREELKCSDAVVNIKFLHIKEGRGLDGLATGMRLANRNIGQSTAKTERLTRELKRISRSLLRVRK